MNYKCPDCKSDKLTEIVEYMISFDLVTGKELHRKSVDTLPPEYECRNCQKSLSYGELLREYDKNEIRMQKMRT